VNFIVIYETVVRCTSSVGEMREKKWEQCRKDV